MDTGCTGNRHGIEWTYIHSNVHLTVNHLHNQGIIGGHATCGRRLNPMFMRLRTVCSEGAVLTSFEYARNHAYYRFDRKRYFPGGLSRGLREMAEKARVWA
jgi:hypothetical protein